MCFGAFQFPQRFSQQFSGRLSGRGAFRGSLRDPFRTPAEEKSPRARRRFVWLPFQNLFKNSDRFLVPTRMENCVRGSKNRPVVAKIGPQCGRTFSPIWIPGSIFLAPKIGPPTDIGPSSSLPADPKPKAGLGATGGPPDWATRLEKYSTLCSPESVAPEIVTINIIEQKTGGHRIRRA